MTALIVLALVVYGLIGLIALVCYVEGGLHRATKKMNERWPERYHIE